MLQINLFRHESENSWITVVTKKIRIDDRRQIILQIESLKPYTASLLEGSIVDTVAESGKAWETSSYFSFVLDRLNRHLKAVAPDLKSGEVRVFLAVIDGEDIHFSVLGSYNAYLVKGGRLTDIAEGMSSGIPEFSYVSSGAIKHPDSLYVSNVDLLDYLTEDDVTELSASGDDEAKRDAIERLIRRETEGKSVDCIALASNDVTDVSRTSDTDSVGTFDQAMDFASKAGSAIKKGAMSAAEKIEIPKTVTDAIGRISKLDAWKNDKYRAAAFGAGIVVCAFLLYAAISSMFQQKSDMSVPEEYKNKLIEAQIILEKAGKDLANKETFKSNLKKSEDLIFEVRKKGVYMNDVKRLLETISILKKQMNGVESYDTKNKTAEFLFPDASFDAVWVFEIQKKYYFVGKSKIIGPFVKGGEAKTFSYPDGEEAIAADTNSEGSIYLFTKSDRVLKFTKGEFAYVNVEGQKTWEPGRSVKTFNSNLYVLSADGTQIYKHKPGVNGFSAKNGVTEGDRTKKSPLIDFAIDGGFYLLKQDLTIDKAFTVPNYNERSIVINNLPDDYAYPKGSDQPTLTVPQNGNYLYLVLQNRIWIFEPDTRNYKDVKSVRYVGQIETVDDGVKSIHVPKDGTIVVATGKGVYQIQFEVSDGKVTIR